MKGRRQDRRRIFFLLGGIFIFCILLMLIFVVRFYHRTRGITSSAEREKDFAALLQDDYDGVILSTFAPDCFNVEDFSHYRGVSMVRADHAFVNLADIGDYLDCCFASNEKVSTVYIGLDPYQISGLYGHHASLYARDYKKYLTDQVSRHPKVAFEVLLPFCSLEVLHTLSESELARLVEAYRNFVNICAPYENVTIYFAGFEEWLIANPGNYDDAGGYRAETISAVVVKTFEGGRYELNGGNMEERFASMTELAQAAPANDIPDLSQWCLICFGDSIFEYNAGSFSVPGVVAGLSGARVYNCGQGGTPAAETYGERLSLGQMVSHFSERDLSGLEEKDNFVSGLTAYMEEAHEERNVCFILNFGLNDYFEGHPIEDPADPYNITTFAGALRSGIRDLQKSYPDAEILVLTPTYTSYFSGGKDVMDEGGGALTDYVDAVLQVAEDMDVYCVNNYADSGINAENEEQYLADGCHPNETGALLLGRCILKEMVKVAADEE